VSWHDRLRAIATSLAGAALTVPAAAAALAATFAIALFCLAPIASASAPPRLGVTAATLIEESTGKQLYGIAPNSRRAIASTTKLMTALLTLEHARLSEIFTQNNFYAAAVDSQIGLVPGERMSVHDLLLALMLPSADDAAEDLAYNVGHGSIARFIGMMNARARQLGLHHTHYSTPSGLDTPGNYSSPNDLVELASYLLTHNGFFRRVVATPRAVLVTGNHVRTVANRNTLVGRVRWVNGVKTGHTSAAGYVLVGSGTQHGITLISAVLGTASESARDANTLALLDYGFDNFHRVDPVRRGQLIATRPVKDQSDKRAKLIAGANVTDVVSRHTRIRLRLELPRQLKGPLARHAVVGRLVVLEDGRPVARVQLLLAHALPAVSPITLAARFLTRPITLVLLVALLAAAFGLITAVRWRVRDRATARPGAA
jgi:serine-type D-Ala-D-Ala carboxypeptidase (penicillin-binding protein 5/6)